MKSLQEYAAGRTQNTNLNPFSAYTVSRDPKQWKPTSTVKATPTPTKSVSKTSSLIATPKVQIKQDESIFKKIGDIAFQFVKPKTISPVPDSVLKKTTPTAPIKLTGGQNRLSKPQLEELSLSTKQSVAKLPNPVESVLNSVKIYAPQTASTLDSLITDPLNKKSDPKRAVDAAWNALKVPFLESLQRSSKALEPNLPVEERVVRKLEAVTGAIGVLFSPVSALFEASNNLPVVGTFTKVLSLPFLTLGEGAPKVSDKIIDELPIPTKTKERVKPVIAEVLTLASQLALGKYFEADSKKTGATIEKIGKNTFEKVTKTMIEDAGTPKTINLTADQVRKINLGAKGFEADLVKSLGLDSGAWRDAVQKGITIQIPAEKIVRIIDKPYWEKIKGFFKIEKTDKTIVTTATPKTSSGFAGYLPDGEYTPQGIIGRVVSNGLEKTAEGKEIIKNALEAQARNQNILVNGKLLEPVKNKGLLEEPSRNQGDNFVMTDKADKNKIEVAKRINEYRTALERFNINPTPTTKERFLKAKVLMDRLKENEYVIEQPSKKIEPVIRTAKLGNTNVEKQVLPQETVTQSEKTEVKPKVVEVPRDQLPIGEGKLKVSRLEARIKETLNKITPEQAKALGDTTIKEMNNKDTIQRASEYVIANPEDALKVLTGEIQPPKGLNTNSIFVAMSNNSVGNIDLARKLASISSSAMGQNIEILKELDKDNPVSIMKDIYKIKEEKLKKTFGNVKERVTNEKKKIRSYVKKPDKYDWNDFINSIDTC